MQEPILDPPDAGAGEAFPSELAPALRPSHGSLSEVLAHDGMSEASVWVNPDSGMRRNEFRAASVALLSIRPAKAGLIRPANSRQVRLRRM